MNTGQLSDSLSETKRRLLEGYRRGERAQNLGSPAKITPRPKGHAAPLSSAQEHIFRREQKSAAGALPHNECITLKTNRYLDGDVLQRCFAEIIRRHEIWRTTYSLIDGQRVQIVHEGANSFPLRIIDLRADSETERANQLSRLYSEGTREPFDFEHGPLLRAVLVHLTGKDQCILVFAHLSIVDGVSVYQILPAELSALYDAFSAGKTSPLADPPIQYSDYACWQKEWLRSPEIEKQLAYWREELADGLPVLPWPREHSQETVSSHRGAIRPFVLRPNLRQELKQFSVGEGVTLFTTLAASLGSLLYSYTGQERILLGTPALGARKRSEIQGLLGHFLNPVLLRIDLQGDPSFHQLLLRVQRALGGALAYDEIPLSVLARELQLAGSSVHNGAFNDFFSVAISLQPETAHADWQVTSMDADSGGTPWDLYLAFIETKHGLIGRAQYNTDVLTEAIVSRTLEGLQAIMEYVMGDPGKTVSALSSNLQGLGLS
jgi:hypothetical protein